MLEGRLMNLGVLSGEKGSVGRNRPGAGRNRPLINGAFGRQPAEKRHRFPLPFP